MLANAGCIRGRKVNLNGFGSLDIEPRELSESNSKGATKQIFKQVEIK